LVPEEEKTMGVPDYVVEATDALKAPDEIWLLMHAFGYDPMEQEWFYNGDHLPGARSVSATREWAEKICGWLQFKYPRGPAPMGGRMTVRSRDEDMSA
jgi:hypothetical protein